VDLYNHSSIRLRGVVLTYLSTLATLHHCRSQWPRGLSHEQSSPAWIVGSNPTQEKDVCVHLFCVCVILRVGSVLRRADPPSMEYY
jgi:hypothetical protein